MGLTEEQARKRYGDDLMILRHDFDHVDRALAEGAGIGFAKFVTRKNGEILGAHIVGPAAGELIHEVVLAMSYKLKVGALKSIIHVYPTLAEINSKTALQLTKQTYASNTRLQGILRRFFRLSPSLGPLTRHCHRPESWRLWESEPLGGARRHPPCARATGTTVF